MKNQTNPTIKLKPAAQVHRISWSCASACVPTQFSTEELWLFSYSTVSSLMA